RQRQNYLGISALAGGEDRPRGALGADRGYWQRVAKTEPGVLGPVLALEAGIAGTPGTHKTGADGGNDNAVLGQFGPQALGQANQRKLAGAVGQQVRHADLAANRADVDDAARTPPAHLRQDREDGIE